MDARVQDLVAEWDDVYKRGQLGLWVLLSLVDSRKYAAEIAGWTSKVTHGAFQVQDQSLYRALRRFRTLGLVSISREPSPHGGPDRKYFALSTLGQQVLAEFTRLNIAPLYEPDVQRRIQTIQQSNQEHVHE